jgi:hypothetical protein
MKLTLLRDAGVVCITIAGVTKVIEVPVHGDRYAFSRIVWVEAGVGIVVLLLWASLWATTARREQREKSASRQADLPPMKRPPP